MFWGHQGGKDGVHERKENFSLVQGHALRQQAELHLKPALA